MISYGNLLKTLLFAGIIFLSGCIIVKHEERVYEIEPEITLSPKPALNMSETLIRSSKGDMIAFLPQGWFLVDVEENITPDILAVAVNPEYNLSAVFMSVRNNEMTTDIIDKEGLFGLARLALERRERKTVGQVKQVGKYQNINMGTQEFVKYEFSSTGGAILAKAAVFISSTEDYYEFALVPINVNNNTLPSSKEFDEVFQSFLASIRY